MLNESIPTASARTASSTVLRMTTSPLSGCPDSPTVTKANVFKPNSISWLVIASSSPQSLGARPVRDEGQRSCSQHGPSCHGPLGGKRAAWSALRLEQLKVELDLHDIAKDDAADARRHGEVDAEVLAADLGRGFEAGVAGDAPRGAPPTPPRPRQDPRTGGVAPRWIAPPPLTPSPAPPP